MFEIFHPESNAGLKVSLAIMHIAAFILQSSNLEWQEKEPIICGGVYFQHKWNHNTHTHTHTQTHLCSFTSVMKKKMWTNVITRWLERWLVRHIRWKITVIQFWMFLVSEDQTEHLRRSKNVLNLQILCITKLKALLIKSFSNPSVSSRVPTAWTYNIQLLFDTTVLKIFGKFREKHQWRNSYCISPNKHPQWLLNFETAVLIRGRRLFQS